jgi:ubiquinone/menaquinone biosynthesis C-methylase UbiE
MSDASKNAPFASLAARYERWYERPLGQWADRRERAVMGALLPLRPGDRILDIGAGMGRYAAELAGRGARVTAIDASEAMVDIARARQAPGFDLVLASATSLPFADASFDGAVSVAAFCFMDAPERALSEAARVIVPGGYLLLGELNRQSVWSTMRRVEARFRPTTYRHARFRNLGEWRDLLRAAGFEPIDHRAALLVAPIDNARYLQAVDPLDRALSARLPQFGAFVGILARRS